MSSLHSTTEIEKNIRKDDQEIRQEHLLPKNEWERHMVTKYKNYEKCLPVFFSYDLLLGFPRPD